MQIEDIYKNTFSQNETTPPSSVWDNIDNTLDELSMENMFKEKLAGSKVNPPQNVWNKIANKLWILGFLRFNPKSVNIYYVSAALLATIGFFALQNDDKLYVDANETTQPETTTIIDINSTFQNKTISQLSISAETREDGKIQKTEDNTVVNIQKNATSKKNEKLEATLIIKPKDTKTLSQKDVETKNFFITGNTKVCQWNEIEYSIDGVTETDSVNWSVDNATKVNSSNNSISVEWEQAGEFELKAEILSNNKKYSTSTKVSVIEMPKSNIIGVSEVCEGSTDIRYKVDNDTDLNKLYLWETKNNPIKIISNGYIAIDWKTPGADTIILSDINTKYNCSFIVKLPVVINPVPKGSLSINRLSNTEYVFGFTLLSDIFNANDLTYNWIIDDEVFNTKSVSYNFSESSITNIDIKVTDNNNCSYTLQEIIQVNKYSLYIPNAFVPRSKEVNRFTPVGKDLISYKMEIYNQNNHKIWETTELYNGEPSTGWDGRINGVVQPKGAYFWRINARFLDGTEWPGLLQNGEYVKFGKFMLVD
jgi:hypothetical protein